MEEFIKITDVTINIQMDMALRFIDCYPDSPIYDEVVEEFLALEPRVKKLVNPVAYLCFTPKPIVKLEDWKDGPMLNVLLTLGDQIESLINEQFDRGLYLSAILANAMTDAYLLQFDEVIQNRNLQLSKERQVGVAKRLDAPTDFPMECQEDILNLMKKHDKLTIGLTSGYMFTTMKTMGYILALCEDMTQNHSAANCDRCDKSEHCTMKR